MNISKNQIWVLIGIAAIVAIGVMVLGSDIKPKAEIGTEDYSSETECTTTEMQKCPEVNGSCVYQALNYCKRLDYPKKD